MDKQVSRKFFNENASHWDETARNNDPAKLENMAERLSFPPEARVLDVGSGTGVFVPFILSKLNSGGRVMCLDFAFQMLEISIEKNDSARIEHVCAEIETVGFEEETFDVVVCYSTFPHFHDKPLALSNMHDMLIHGGKIFICHTANRERINNIHRSVPDLSDHLIPPENEMHQMMVQAGFSDPAIVENEDYYLAVGKKLSLS